MKKLIQFVQNKIETKGSNWFVIRFIIIVFLIIFVCGFLPLVYSIATGRPEGFSIEQIEIADRFDRKDERIYCTITIGNSIIGQPISPTLVAKWYHDGEQITVHYFEARSGEPFTIWLEPPPGQDFQPGKYELQIYTETIEFEVE